MSLETFLAIAGFVGALLGGFWAIGRTAIATFNRGLDERFKSQDIARTEGRKALEERFQRMEEKQDATDTDVRRILIELPREYVRREDYVRSQTIVEAKLDSLALRIENALLKGAGRD